MILTEATTLAALKVAEHALELRLLYVQAMTTEDRAAWAKRLAENEQAAAAFFAHLDPRTWFAA